MYTLLVGTTNQHKLIEIKELLSDLAVRILNLSQFTYYPPVIEDGKTFEENALKKARAYFDYFHIPVFADDSGLVVPALKDEPGVLSARYAGAGATYAQNNQLLIKRLLKLNPSERKGKFICTVCYIDSEHEELFMGITEGLLLTELKGNGGFGYDPLFYVPSLKKSYAEMSLQEKNALSHRGQALNHLKQFLKEQILPMDKLLT